MKLWTLLVLTCLISQTWSASLSKFEAKKYKHILEGQGLYSSDDDVEVLTSYNFNKEVNGAPIAWVVEFYNSWCGFCQRFAPSWKALATDIKPWSEFLKIGAIDCSDEDNNPICRNHEIMAYPTLRYFHENYELGEGKIGDEVAKGTDMASHRANIVGKLIQEQTEGRAKLLPNLQPFTDSNLEKVFDNLPNEVKYSVIVIEQGDGLLGATIALDLRKVKEVAVRYAFKNNSALINELKITQFPSLVILAKENNNREIYSDDLPTREAIRTAIKTYLAPRQIQIKEPPKKPLFVGKWIESQVPDNLTAILLEQRAQQALREHVKKMGDVVIQMDLETTLRYALKREVGSNRVITGEKLQNLTNYLKLLEKYFPFGQKGQFFLHDLVQLVEGRNEVTGAEITKLVREAEREDAQVFSSPEQWLGCKGSTPTTRRYPCGLWKLFHYLTVNAAEKPTASKNPREVLEGMYGYIRSFFGCADCSQHFQEMAHKRDLWNVSSHDSAIIWLWMAHNEVNKRLAGDETEDPQYPKTQFPSKENCPLCRTSENSWNLPEVLRYLKNMYSSINIRYIGSDTRVLHIGLEGPAADRNGGGSLFKTLDMSMCFILYVSSFLLLTVLIRLFLKRGYRKKPYVHDLLGKV